MNSCIASVWIEPHFDGIRPDDATAEDASRQPRDIVVLEAFEHGDPDLRGVGNLTQRQAAPLARVP